LVELQTDLLKVDAKDWTKRLIFPIVLLCAAVVVGIGCVPILLTSLAEALVLWLEISRALALLIAGATGLVLTALCGLIGWQRLRGSFTVFGRSREEMQRNIRWLRRVLRPQQTSNNNRRT
jgi:hypothetical protein